ncbi:MAG TPA: hypothetical protein DCY79_23810, partial [Planctomycetaceae bacterium]|nr:hypothetical protein [Planctomycetaceae bacterium]
MIQAAEMSGWFSHAIFDLHRRNIASPAHNHVFLPPHKPRVAIFIETAHHDAPSTKTALRSLTRPLAQRNA